MAKKKQKFYVVWVGLQPGIYEDWNSCKLHVDGYPGAIYKSFSSRQMAETAYNKSPDEFIGADIMEVELTEEERMLIGDPIMDSISVDGAWNTATGIVEYQGVHTSTGEQLFKVGPFDDGTNN